MKVISRYFKNGDKYVRVRLENGRVMGEHRYLMEQHLGRALLRTEFVHHIDGNPRNNKLDNLAVVTAKQHIVAHREPARTVTLVCPICGCEFKRLLRYVTERRSHGQRDFLCGRTCRRSGRGNPIVHGTRAGYQKGCRCPECRSAQTEALRVYRATKSLGL